MTEGGDLRLASDYGTVGGSPHLRRRSPQMKCLLFLAIVGLSPQIHTPRPLKLAPHPFISYMLCETDADCDPPFYCCQQIFISVCCVPGLPQRIRRRLLPNATPPLPLPFPKPIPIPVPT